MHKIKFVLLYSLLFVLYFTQAQSNDSLLKQYPDQDAVYLKASIHLNIGENEGTISAKTIELEKKRILNNPNPNNYWVDVIYFNSLVQLKENKAFIKDPKDNKYENEGYFAEVESTYSDTEIASDMMKQKVYFADAVNGREIQLQYEKIIKDPHLLPTFYLDMDFPVIKRIYQITVDDGIEIGWLSFGLDSLDIEYTEKHSYGKTIHYWVAKDVYPIEPDPNGPEYIALAPMIIPYIKSFTYNGKTTQYFGTITDLHRWYVSMIERSSSFYDPDKNVLKISKSITDTCDTEEEKIKAVFQWVQTNIKYLYSDSGLGGFIPEDADKVMYNRYGDCKAMTNLTYELLKNSGIKSYFAWVGTYDLPFTYENNPTPSTDNHMILAIEKKDGDFQLLDATNSYGSFYDTPYYLQGKETLISLSDSTYLIKTFPKENYQDNILYDSNYIFEEGDQLKSRSFMKMTGSQKYKAENGFPLVHKEIIDYIEENYLMANKKTSLDHITFSGIKDRTDSLQLSFDYLLQNHLVVADGKKYINLNFDKPLVRFDLDLSKRKTDYLFKYPSLYQYVSIYEIPDNYQLEYLPPNKSYHHERFSMDIQYTQTDRTIKLSRDISIKDRIIKTNDFNDWNEFVNLLKQSYTEVLVVKITEN